MAKGARTLQTEFRVVRRGRRACAGASARRPRASTPPAGGARQRRHRSTSPNARERKSARTCWPARSITAPAMRWRVAQSIVRLTRANSVDDYVGAVEGRIKALARAHALLSDARWHSADLGALVAEELAPYRVGEADKVEVTGPNVSLPPHMAQGLALAVHELATNAAKHGALSSLPARSASTGNCAPTSRLALDRERWPAHCPAVGAQLRPQGDPRQHRESARRQGDIRVGPARHAMHLVHPAAGRWPRRAGEPVSSVADNGGKAARSPAGRRVLVVEDEALVAMMIQEFLTESGHAVIGPISGPRKRCWPPRRATSTPPFSTSISATAWPIRSPRYLRRAACRSSSSPATRPTQSTIGSAMCRSCRSRSSGKRWSDFSLHVNVVAIPRAKAAACQGAARIAVGRGQARLSFIAVVAGSLRIEGTGFAAPGS